MAQAVLTAREIRSGRGITRRMLGANQLRKTSKRSMVAHVRCLEVYGTASAICGFDSGRGEREMGGECAKN